MPADLTKNNGFGESCCDGGECAVTAQSAQPCGCDAGANWLCERHRYERLIAIIEANNKEVREKNGETDSV